MGRSAPDAGRLFFRSAWAIRTVFRRRFHRPGVWLTAAFALTVGLVLSAHPTGMAPLATGRRYMNPVFDRPFPDPMVLKVGHDFYAYGTTMSWEPPGHLFPVLHSIDLVHWRYVGDAFPRIPRPIWGYDDWWAPSVLAVHGTYYLYYTGKDIQTDNHCIAVATSRHPAGPFTHRAVIGCGDDTASGYIDPAPFVDRDGRAYLYFSVDGPRHSISVVRLRPDLVHAVGDRAELFGVSQSWESGPNGTTVEGPWLLGHGRHYYLFYSGNDWQTTYAMGYATAQSPLGPFHKSSHDPILRGAAHVTGPGGGSVVEGPHGGSWLVYHGCSDEPCNPGQDVRTLRIDALIWRGDEVTVRGPTARPEPAP